jgi:hypothetical protein
MGFVDLLNEKPHYCLIGYLVLLSFNTFTVYAQIGPANTDSMHFQSRNEKVSAK